MRGEKQPDLDWSIGAPLTQGQKIQKWRKTNLEKRDRDPANEPGTQIEVAAALGVAQARVSEWEKDRRGVSWKVGERLVALMGLPTVHYLRDSSKTWPAMDDPRLHELREKYPRLPEIVLIMLWEFDGNRDVEEILRQHYDSVCRARGNVSGDELRTIEKESYESS